MSLNKISCWLDVSRISTSNKNFWQTYTHRKNGQFTQIGTWRLELRSEEPKTDEISSITNFLWIRHIPTVKHDVLCFIMMTWSLSDLDMQEQTVPNQHSTLKIARWKHQEEKISNCWSFRYVFVNILQDANWCERYWWHQVPAAQAVPLLLLSVACQPEIVTWNADVEQMKKSQLPRLAMRDTRPLGWWT